MQYLDALFKRDSEAGHEYHALQVPLYAEFDRARLLPFLQRSSYYPLQQALDHCKQRQLIPEMVFLLGMYITLSLHTSVLCMWVRNLFSGISAAQSTLRYPVSRAL